MRIIDADKLLNKIDAYMCGSQDVMFVKELIKQQPTAFDVEKVVSELEEQISKHDLLFNKYVKDKDKSCSWSISELNKIRGLLEAIDVVKAGEV